MRRQSGKLMKLGVEKWQQMSKVQFPAYCQLPFTQAGIFITTRKMCWSKKMKSESSVSEQEMKLSVLCVPHSPVIWYFFFMAKKFFFSRRIYFKQIEEEEVKVKRNISFPSIRKAKIQISVVKLYKWQRLWKIYVANANKTKW